MLLYFVKLTLKAAKKAWEKESVSTWWATNTDQVDRERSPQFLKLLAKIFNDSDIRRRCVFWVIWWTNQSNISNPHILIHFYVIWLSASSKFIWVGIYCSDLFRNTQVCVQHVCVYYVDRLIFDGFRFCYYSPVSESLCTLSKTHVWHVTKQRLSVKNRERLKLRKQTFKAKKASSKLNKTYQTISIISINGVSIKNRIGPNQTLDTN